MVSEESESESDPDPLDEDELVGIDDDRDDVSARSPELLLCELELTFKLPSGFAPPLSPLLPPSLPLPLPLPLPVNDEEVPFSGEVPEVPLASIIWSGEDVADSFSELDEFEAVDAVEEERKDADPDAGLVLSLSDAISLAATLLLLLSPLLPLSVPFDLFPELEEVTASD